MDPDRLVVTTAVALLAVSWVVFVFEGSQSAYICALVASSALAAWLARRRSVWAVVLLIGEFALLGPEANGTLAPGAPPLGSLRLVDVTLTVAVVAVLTSSPGVRQPNFRAAATQVAAWARSRPELWICAALLVWTTALWLTNGAPIDGLTKSDLRLLMISVGTALLAAACTKGGTRVLLTGLLAAGIMAAGKAAAIYFTEFWAIGSSDRLQASLAGTPDQLRVILVGGDTLLILIPALATLAVRTRLRIEPAWLAPTAAVAALGAVVISGTRTSLPLAVLLMVGVAALERGRRGGVTATRVRIAAAGVVCIGALAAGMVASGLADRFQTADAPHVGLNFRKDELRSFYELPTADLLAGQGLGGRFQSKDVNGAPAIAGWAHAYPVWLQLKAGLLGIVAALALLTLALRHAANRRRAGGEARTAALGGAVLILGVLAMSMTLGRAGLPEGVVLLALGSAMIYGPTAPLRS